MSSNSRAAAAQGSPRLRGTAPAQSQAASAAPARKKSSATAAQLKEKIFGLQADVQAAEKKTEAEKKRGDKYKLMASQLEKDAEKAKAAVGSKTNPGAVKIKKLGIRGAMQLDDPKNDALWKQISDTVLNALREAGLTAPTTAQRWKKVHPEKQTSVLVVCRTKMPRLADYADDWATEQLAIEKLNNRVKTLASAKKDGKGKTVGKGKSKGKGKAPAHEAALEADLDDDDDALGAVNADAAAAAGNHAEDDERVTIEFSDDEDLV